MPWVAMVCSDMSEANLDKKLGASSLHIRKDKSIETIEAAKKVLGSRNLNFCFVQENLQPLCAFILTTELRHEKKTGNISQSNNIQKVCLEIIKSYLFI
jgi:hypothetical protein